MSIKNYVLVVSIGQPVLEGPNIVIVPCRVFVFNTLMNTMSYRLLVPAKVGEYGTVSCLCFRNSDENSVISVSATNNIGSFRLLLFYIPQKIG